MKHIKLFENFIDKEAIKDIADHYIIGEYTINDDGTIDVRGDVKICDTLNTKLPVKFRSVSGDFNCDNNYLKSLEGCPETVGGNFDCSDNQLTTLEGGPRSVGRYYDCSKNKLNDLKGSPEYVGLNFNCEFNNLTTLEGCPQKVGGDLECSYNSIFNLQGLDIDNFEMYVSANPIEQIWNLFKDKDADTIELFNYMDPTYIDEDGVACCSLTRLNAFLEEIGEEPVTGLKGIKCVK